MALTGQLTSPDIKMSLELPNERDEVQALVRNYIPTDEQMNMQILYLLGIGKFYTPENVDATGNSNMMSSVLSSTLSGQLNNALADYRQQQLELRHKLQHRRKRLDGHGVRDNAFRATAE